MESGILGSPHLRANRSLSLGISVLCYIWNWTRGVHRGTFQFQVCSLILGIREGFAQLGLIGSVSKFLFPYGIKCGMTAWRTAPDHGIPGSGEENTRTALQVGLR